MEYLLLLIFSGIAGGLPANKDVAQLHKGTPVFSHTANKKSSADLTGPWQILVDDYLIDKKINITRVYHPFTKYAGNPLLIADKPWEGRTSYVYGTVLPTEQGEGYRMWYQGWTGKEYTNLYATSSDGLTWKKPELGMVDFNGSSSNNIFLRRTKEDHLPQIIYTPWEKDTNRRYKLINYDYGRTKPNHLVSGFWGSYSKDGIHWTDVNNNPVLKDPGDVGNFVWDAHAKRYTGYPKVFAPVRGFSRRCVGVTATTDFEHWPSAQLILVPDKADDHWVSGNNQRTEFYGLTAFPYESAYLGFLWIFHISDGINDGPIYCELVSSRNGINWVREETIRGERLPILPLGANGTWDQGMIFTTNHPLVENDVVKLWYGGFNVTHDNSSDSERAGIGLATLRKDGFASLDAAKTVGVVTTKPLKNLHGQLYLNANASIGSIKVEVLTAKGEVLHGFSRNNCKVIRSDGTKLLVTWQNHSFLPDLPGVFCLRFILQNASLYSFMGGKSVDLAYEVQPQEIEITFKRKEKIKPGLVLKEKQFKKTVVFAHAYNVQGDVTIVDDLSKSRMVVGAARFPSSGLQSPNLIEVLNTKNLGARFTLMAMVRTSNHRLTRLFSNYRGSGEFVTGELLFDFDPTGSEIPGLRFIVNGQTVVSKPLKFADEKYHLIAVTYELGKVILYFDGLDVGEAQLQFGSAPLHYDKTVLHYFEQPYALPEVGIHLGSNLNIGGDIGGAFVTYKDTVTGTRQAQLKGYVSEIRVAERVLTPAEIRQLYNSEIQQ
jgi:hypothetical protein